MINPTINFKYDDNQVFKIKAKKASHTDRSGITMFDVDAVGDILEELPPDGFKKMLQYTTQKAYSFAGQSLTLADCMNTLIRDYNSIKNTHPRVGYYYNAMCFEFLQRSLLVVGADPERITELDTRITEEFNKFKGISV